MSASWNAISGTSNARSPSGRPWSPRRGPASSTTRCTISSTRRGHWGPIRPSARIAARLGEEARAGKPVALVPAPKAADEVSRPRFAATEDGASLVSDAYDFTITWPLSWRVDNMSSSPETGLLIDFATGRVLREDGE